MADVPVTPNGIPDFHTAIQILSALAREKTDDFRVKVFRKPSPSANLSAVATFDGARVEHFLSPEAWLVPFCGGGPIYLLWAFHMSDPTKLVVQVLPPQVNGQPREPNLTLPGSPGWSGPATLISPRPPEAPAANPSADLSALFPVPGAPRQPGGPAREAGATTGNAGSPGHSSSEEERLTALRLQIIDQQRRQDAERIEKMIEAQAKATERQINALLAVVEKANTAAPRAPEKTLVEQIAALTPVLSLVVPLFQASREKDAAAQRAAEEREARRMEREDKQREETMKLILGMNEKAAAVGGDTMKMIAPMVEAVAQMSRTSLQTAATMRELMPQMPEDEGMIGLVKALAPAVAEFLAMKSQGPQPQPPQGQLPAQTPPPSAGSNGQPPPTAAAPEVDVATIPADDLAARVDAAIRAHHDPNDLAAGYLDALVGNAGFAEKVRTAGGTWPYFKATLAAWAVEQAPGADGKTNMVYLREVAGVLKAAALARGITL